jgi:hypothetical protein
MFERMIYTKVAIIIVKVAKKPVAQMMERPGRQP